MLSRSNIITKAIRDRRSRPYPPLQVANGLRSMSGPQPVSEAAVTALRAAWLPTIPGQAVPMLGERVSDAEPCRD